jgi:hypothetical protein|tara:strand:+ start:4967 stop:5485 length:519 start_codon:yes stop_codon:yes gene_type:complete
MKLDTFNTETLEVQWAHLHRADDKFGAPGHHNITVVVDDQLNDQLNKIAKEAGAAKINGLSDKEGKKFIKVKSTLYTNPPEGMEKKVAFPCVDSDTNSTDETPMGGDKVRLRLKPFVISRDNSMSFFLNGCQIIEKNGSSGSTSGFSATEGYKAPAQAEETVPSNDDNDVPF